MSDRLGLGTDADIRITKVNTPKNKEDAPATGSGVKRKRTKLIRLDDLIPEKDVKGGRQLPFGVTDTTRTNDKGK